MRGCPYFHTGQKAQRRDGGAWFYETQIKATEKSSSVCSKYVEGVISYKLNPGGEFMSCDLIEFGY